MKTVAKSILLGLLMLASFCGLIALTADAAHARPADDHLVKTAAPHVVYSSPAGDMIHLNIAKSAGQPLLVQIVDNSGKVLVNKYFFKNEQGSIKLKFDVSELEDGDYQVRLTNNTIENRHSFTLNTAKATEVNRVLSMK